MIGFMLGDSFLLKLFVSLVYMIELKRINSPNKGNEECTKEKHDGFLLNHTEIMFIVIFEFHCLYCNSHHSSCEKHAHCILKSE